MTSQKQEDIDWEKVFREEFEQWCERFFPLEEFREMLWLAFAAGCEAHKAHVIRARAFGTPGPADMVS